MNSIEQRWKYRVVAFDLDGTLLRGTNFDYSWKLVWQKQKLPMNLHHLKTRCNGDVGQRSEALLFKGHER